jgi:hypothetical protein
VLAKECPNLSFTEAMKHLGDRWKRMTDKEKEPFNEISKKDQKRYDFEISNPNKLNPEDLMYKKQKKKKGDT